MEGKPMCKYGKLCYRKNPTHFKEYSHPKETEDDESSEEESSPSKKKLKYDTSSIEKSGSSSIMQSFFGFTKARGIQSKYNSNSLALDIKDILSKNPSKLNASAQFNYMVDIPWLVSQYPSSQRGAPLLIIHGDTGNSKTELEEQANLYDHVDLYQAKLPISFGTHHSKMMLLLYDDGLIVVIHTANLIPLDWDQKTQGVWMSPLFPRVEKDVELTRSNTFQEDLLDYLAAYGDGCLNYWRKVILRHDMSTARVRIVASVPGRHTGSDKFRWGHLKLRKLLLNHGPLFSEVDSSWDIIGQFSSIGSLGPTADQWLCGEWRKSFSACKGQTLMQENTPADLKLIFPTVENVRTSLEGYRAGGSLPYSMKTAVKQKYLTQYLHQWKADMCGRTHASPHVKTYTRVSRDCERAAWYLVTSSNLSKAAWGAFEKNKSQLMIRSYEIGVLLLPRDQLPAMETLKLSSKQDIVSSSAANPSFTVLTLPYDLPLLAYTPNDEPWIWDKPYRSEKDSCGELWSP